MTGHCPLSPAGQGSPSRLDAVGVWGSAPGHDSLPAWNGSTTWLMGLPGDPQWWEAVHESRGGDLVEIDVIG
jgi:hypothetical protein